ncbi:histone H5-like [Dysidea avara]|uniref:histone H5-like n=1 Tax=Dysidea avara TaxID=196820 RepID=UPI00331897F3
MPSKTKSKSKGARRLKKATSAKPKYSDMIVAAITAMQERGGTSIHKILRYIGANYKVGKGFEVHARLALKKLLQAGNLVCTKGSGASGSYKLAAKKPTRRRPAAKRPSRAGAAKKAGKRRKSGKRKAAPKKRRASPKKKSSVGRKRSATRKPRSSAKKPRTTLRRRLPRRRCAKK